MNQVLQDFNDVTDSIEDMKDKLSKCQDQIQKIMDKASDCSSSLTKLQAEQSVLRAKMVALGVDTSKLSKCGHVVPGVHFTQKVVQQPTTSTTKAVEHSTAETAEMGLPPTTSAMGLPPTTSAMGLSPTTSSMGLPPTTTTISAEIHSAPPDTPEETTQSTQVASSSVATTETPQTTQVIVASSSVATAQTPQSSQAAIPASTSAVTISSFVGEPQQIVNIGGQNVLIAGSGPSTIGGLSIRYRKILKGQHKFFCVCKHPFTTQADLNRHLRENCPMTEKKQKHKCPEDGCGKEFSSNQYLREHQHEVHFKTFLYFCRPCGQGFYKHCKLNHHKKNCLSYLSGPPKTTAAVTSTYTPTSAIQPQSGVTTSTAQIQQVSIPVDTPGVSMPVDTSRASSEVQIVGTTEGDQAVSYEFSAPKLLNWNHPPNVDDDDEENFPDVQL